MRNPIRVLLVDDNVSTRALLKGFFEQVQGVEVCGEARDGWEGVELLHSLKPDLMMLDLIMPGLDGIGLLEALRDEESLPRPKIIVLSGVGSDEFVQRTCRLGVNYYLMKPVKLDELAHRVADLFPHREERPGEGLAEWSLTRMGAKQDVRGFSFLCSGARALAGDGNRQLKEVYLQLAKEFDTSYDCVEKNLRTAIRQIHDGRSEAYLAAFGGGERPPTNGDFLRWLAGELSGENNK